MEPDVPQLPQTSLSIHVYQNGEVRGSIGKPGKAKESLGTLGEVWGRIGKSGGDV